MQTTRLNVLDELYLHLDREDEPWSVHVEMRVTGRVDERRLEAAVREAACVTPIARARLAESRTPTSATSGRSRTSSTTPTSRSSTARSSRRPRAPAERTPTLDRPGRSHCCSRTTGGDVIVLNLHHAAGDGLPPCG